MADGFRVDPAALNGIGKGIDGAISELKTLGIDASAEQGRGFDELEMSAAEVGHEGLSDALTAFCDRWQWGVRTLVQDGSEFAHRIGLAAGSYWDQEKYAQDLLHEVVGDVVGNPHETGEQFASQSLGQIAGAALHPDYSSESWQRAGNHMAAQWKGVVRDGAAGPGGVEQVAAAAGHGDEVKRVLDQTLGPVPGTEHG